MFKFVRLAILIAFFLVGFLSLAVQAKAPAISVLQIRGVINPVSADYVRRGIEQSEKNGDVTCIIQMDTPGA
jgi:membrane-bound serine protease (ClpP class)